MSEPLLDEVAHQLSTLQTRVTGRLEVMRDAIDAVLARLNEHAAGDTEVTAVRRHLRDAFDYAERSIVVVIGKEVLVLGIRHRRIRARAFRRAPLETELLNGDIGRVLLLHDADRWDFGDFIRHSSWVTSLAATGASVDVASHPAYLTLLQSDDRVNRLLDASRVGDPLLAGYDLVVVPGAAAPTALSPAVARGIYPHNTGWLYTRYGSPVHGGMQHELNYFRTARHHHGQTALPTAQPLSLRLPADNVREIGATLRGAFDNDQPVVVYNPTAADPRTRQTTIPKDVENVISGLEHATMLRALREILPGHNVLIGSALVPGDMRNAATIRDLSRTFGGDPQVTSIFDLHRPELTTLRGFSMMLASDAVVASTGTTSGINTHLSSMVGLPSFSVERATDAEIQANWARHGVLPMGSVRWRNPSPLAGAVNVDRLGKTPAEFERAAAAFALHLGVHTDRVDKAVNDVAHARALAGDFQRILDSGPPHVVVSAAIMFRASLRFEAQDLYGDLSDEFAFLRRERANFASVRTLDDLLDASRGLGDQDAELVRNVIKDSMLHKVAQVLAPTSKQIAPESPDERLLRKLRAHAPLTTAELDSLAVRDEFELAAAMRERLTTYLSARAAVAASGGTTFQVGWQHEVTVDEGIVVKTLSTNDASEYLTDEYTLSGIRAAIDSAGGLVPPSVLLGDGTTVSRRLKMLVEPGGTTVAPELGHAPVSETALALGWVDEQLDGYLRLGDQGIFNFDIKFKDVGMDDYGVLQVADFSVVTRLDQQPEQWPPPNLRTDVFHMGVNELIRNGQYLREFANGDQVQEHYLTQVERRIGIDLRPYLDDWEWGDHGYPAITPLASQLRKVFMDRARTATPRPVFPLVDYASEGMTFDYVSERLLESRNPR